MYKFDSVVVQPPIDPANAPTVRLRLKWTGKIKRYPMDYSMTPDACVHLIAHLNEALDHVDDMIMAEQFGEDGLQ